MASATPYDFDQYKWRRSLEDRSYFSRPVGGSELIEDIWHRYMDGEQKLFLGVTLELGISTPTNSFLDRARDAWIATRRVIPTVAARTEYALNGRPHLAYRVPKDHAESVAWAERTVCVDTSADNLDEVRVEIGKKPIPSDDGDQTFIYILPFSDISFGLLLFTSHVPFDGAGTKAVMNVFLGKLAQYIVDPSLVAKETIPWGPEVDELLPFITEVLADDEPREGPAYQRTLVKVMEDLDYTTPVRLNIYGTHM